MLLRSVGLVPACLLAKRWSQAETEGQRFKFSDSQVRDLVFT